MRYFKIEKNSVLSMDLSINFDFFFLIFKIDTQIHTQKIILFLIILFEICERFAKYPNPNLNLWVFWVHMYINVCM